MAGISWAQQAIDKFFESREYPTQLQRDDNALAVLGSPSYTVLYTDNPDNQPDYIVYFREFGSTLDQDPVPTHLHIYRMSYLRRVPCLEVLSTKVKLSLKDKTRHVSYVKHLASIPLLREEPYPQILTHNDLSETNILVDVETFEITGVIDWSLAKELSFGLELDSLLLTIGCMELSGWHNYTCCMLLLDAFGDEFWTQPQEVRIAAMPACSATPCFPTHAGGSPSEDLVTPE
ncbi:hypothetical protein BGW36DRAFT_400336 [Talaromyces proteolyticus]|uniref:Aminoglycoside phosphotransferase domain-containing protein n=1 Tax=Talaromyces proteolyticus TaxID=1131652 RepID=A0AAD4PWC6_9EURO|nr:uncharacterized protein BGW36DRAFT_400336 [Talaromyces proteolyticus]KAH8692293.1 hypothetical protein BGW36DRAFT_400336 [Talaromyces proteolyticus]